MDLAQNFLRHSRCVHELCLRLRSWLITLSCLYIYSGLSDDIHRKLRCLKCGDILCRPQKCIKVAIAVWQIDRHKLCRSPSHTLSIDETQCFACKKHLVVVLIVVIVICLVVDLVNTLFLCITGQPDWTLVDLCPKFSLKPFGIYHQSAILFVDIIFSFLFSFFQRRPAYKNTSTVLKKVRK